MARNYLVFLVFLVFTVTVFGETCSKVVEIGDLGDEPVHFTVCYTPQQEEDLTPSNSRCMPRSCFIDENEKLKCPGHTGRCHPRTTIYEESTGLTYVTDDMKVVNAMANGCGMKCSVDTRGEYSCRFECSYSF